MADSFKPLLIAGLVGAAGWFWFKSQDSTASGTATLTLDDVKKLIADGVKAGGSTTPNGGTTTGTGKTLAEKFLAASGNASALNAHQWSYFRTAVGLDPLTAEKFGELFGDGNTQMSIAEYLTKVGLSGISAIQRRNGSVVAFNPVLVRNLVLASRRRAA